MLSTLLVADIGPGQEVAGRSWTGSLLSTPLAVDLWPGPDAAADGGDARRVVCFVRLSPPTAGLALWLRLRWAMLRWATPLAADLGPGTVAAAEVGHAGQGVCSLRLSPPN